MADTQALQCCLMLMACSDSFLQALLAAHRREAAVRERARALAREHGPRAERPCVGAAAPSSRPRLWRCTQPISWILTASRLSRTRAQSPFQNTCVEICGAHPDLQFLMTRKAAGVRDPGQTVRWGRLARPAAAPGAWCAPGIACRHGYREMRTRLCRRLTAVGAPDPGTR